MWTSSGWPWPAGRGEPWSACWPRARRGPTPWETATVAWYGGQTATVDIATGTAIWYHGGLPPVALRWVLIRLIRAPQGAFAPQAFLATDPVASATDIVHWFVCRWPLEVTFHEVRAHLGVETQRQWSELAIQRTTPALLGLFSVVTLCAHELLHGQPLPVRQAAWYTKSTSTFVDTLALVRRHLWPVTVYCTSPAPTDSIQIPRALWDRCTDTLAFAA